MDSVDPIMVMCDLPKSGNERLPLTDQYVEFTTEGVIQEINPVDIVELKDVRLKRANPSQPTPMKDKELNITTGDIKSANQSGRFTGINQGTVNLGATKGRAMVVPIAFSGEPKVDKPFTVFVRYKNRGKVIAKDVRVVFFAYGIKKGEKPEFDIVAKESPEGGAVFFLTPDEESTSYHTHNKGKPLAAGDVAEVGNGNVVIYAFGKIYYRDTPKCSHWTTFCVFYDPSIKRYSVYSEYNETDEMQCP